MIRLWASGDERRWDEYVAANPGARCCHLSAWKRIIEDSFGHRTYYLLSEDDDGRIDGVLPIVRLRSYLFGDFLVSVPYLNYGGACGQDDRTTRGLMEAGVRTAADLRVNHLEIRTETPADYGLQIKSSKVSMRLSLPDSADALWKGFSAKLRSQVKRARQESMTVRVGREEEVDAFYHVFATNMRDLGTPVYARRFFETILRELRDSTWICCVYVGQQPVAAGLLLGFRDVLEIPWASSLRRYNRLSPNMLLYWSVLKSACERGFRLFDFGRSSPDSGPFRFKAQWGAAPVQLYWHYWLRDGGALPDLTPHNPRMQIAVRLWRRLPVSVTKLLGPPIAKSLP
jgi:serine/alanine adding enzyme